MIKRPLLSSMSGQKGEILEKLYKESKQ